MRIEPSQHTTPYYESNIPPKHCISTSWTKSTLCSPAVTLFSWLKALFAKIFCYRKKESLIAISLKKFHLYELEEFTSFVKKNWTPEISFSNTYHDQWKKLSPVIQEELEKVSILAFQKRVSESSFKFAKEDVIHFGTRFIQKFEFSYDARMLIINNKKIEESARELLLEILDKVIKEWKKDISS